MNKQRMFKKNAAIIVLLGLLTCLTLVFGCGDALLDEGVENPLLLKFSPSTVTINGTNQTTDVDVMVEKASYLMAARFSISFDQSVVEVINIKTSGTGFMFTDADAQVSVLESYYNNDSGKIIVGIGALKRAFLGASGDGKLATITFKSKKIETADLSFVNSQPTDIFMSVYSAYDERGWEEQQVLTYNGLIVVHEKIEVESPQ